ncbi:CIA30 family protein [Glaciecola petra]|uniref:CIA30 family protein n=1 Tax=Glaciecola petra TaxID=3075602 RepID=A0ABU2ZU05_9ALTE|nr:CIA30 family protein [Aestuariibacter sp. P117]MDT0596129.1 CIA30 family protein [Aestuariibacter sp. P117]
MQNSHIQFSLTNEIDNWVIVNDTVMGGRSKAQLDIVKNMLIFSGSLSLQNNGGFASTRRVYKPVEWDPKQAFQITIEGDGRAYQFRLRTNRRMDGVAYVVGFQTVAGKSQSFTFEPSDFEPLWRGRYVRGAEALTFDDVSQLGFMLADKTPGEFSLKVKSITQVPLAL